MAALALVLGALATIPAGVRSIGVCYGMNGDDLPSASDVVQLYKDNGIDSMRIYSPDTDVLQALSGSGIAVTVGVPNADVGGLASRPSAAAAWVQSYVLAFPAVQFRYIAVGNEVVAGGRVLLPAMRNLDRALSAAGLADDIKVSTAVAIDVLGSSFPPSAGTFAPSAGYMAHVARYLQSTGAPLLANLYPYFVYTLGLGHLGMDFALFTAPGTVVQDGEYGYQNLFDATVDALYAAVGRLGVAGGDGVRVVVSETGWPTAGGAAASLENARTYNQNLVRHVWKGTPRRPRRVEAYVFAMFNEDKKDAGVEQNWGLFYPNMERVYPITFRAGRRH